MDRYQLTSFHPSSTESQGFAASIGFFDGVHLGHRFLLRALKALAKRKGLRTLVVTFDEHPRRILQPNTPLPLLTTHEEKLRLLADCGIDACMTLHFTEEMAGFTAYQFMEHFLAQWKVEALLTGYDHRFGRPQKGEGFEQYVAYGRALGIEVVDAQKYEGQLLQEPCWLDEPADRKKKREEWNAFRSSLLSNTVSSSLIRGLLVAGEVKLAKTALGRPYVLVGTIVEGRKNGRKLGFPTANLRVNDPQKVVPSQGVYVTQMVVDGQTYGAMTNIGQRPTLDNGKDVTLESHLFDVDLDLYGKTVELFFIQRLRSELRFPSLEALQNQLHLDAQQARECLSDLSLP